MMVVLVSRTPDGWATDCLDCYGGAGGPLDLGEWTLKREAEDAAKAHRAEHKGKPTCPTCGQAVA